MQDIVAMVVSHDTWDILYIIFIVIKNKKLSVGSNYAQHLPSMHSMFCSQYPAPLVCKRYVFLVHQSGAPDRTKDRKPSVQSGPDWKLRSRSATLKASDLVMINSLCHPWWLAAKAHVGHPSNITPHIRCSACLTIFWVSCLFHTLMWLFLNQLQNSNLGLNHKKQSTSCHLPFDSLSLSFSRTANLQSRPFMVEVIATLVSFVLKMWITMTGAI